MNLGEITVFSKLAGLTPEETERLMKIGFADAPASKAHHLSRQGGLADHSFNVAQRLVLQTEALDVQWSRPESAWRVALLHDLVKCQCYRRRADGGYDYIQPVWPSHGIASVVIATVELDIKLNPDEAASIAWHMGAFNLQGRQLEELDAALDVFPSQIIATHAADMAAARIDEMEGSIA